MAWSNMADMELTDEEKLDAISPVPSDRPDYPWGLRICLTERELKKLKLDPSDCGIGDFIDMRAFACVTSISKNPGPDGEECCRVELQIERLAVENEDTESMDE